MRGRERERAVRREIISRTSKFVAEVVNQFQSSN